MGEGGSAVKKLLIAVVIVALLAGCAGEQGTVEKERCNVCGDDVDRFIRTVYEDYICASCFWKDGWQICRGCDLAYDLDEFDCADGYCTGCAETYAWSCSVCEERYGLDHLVDLGNGYYLCAACTAPRILDNAPEIAGDIAAISPFAQRGDDYVG